MPRQNRHDWRKNWTWHRREEIDRLQVCGQDVTPRAEKVKEAGPGTGC